jgi:hypothetical protein
LIYNMPLTLNFGIIALTLAVPSSLDAITDLHSNFYLRHSRLLCQ